MLLTVMVEEVLMMVLAKDAQSLERDVRMRMKKRRRNAFYYTRGIAMNLLHLKR